MASRDIFSALQVPDFRWLWLGSLGSSFAMNMQIIARGWLVYTLTSSSMDLAWVTLSFMLPTVAFSLWGGVVADRLPKKRIIVTAQTLNCVATLVMAAIILSDKVTFWDFIWFGFFNGTVLALSMPARQAFVPELIPDRLIFTAMALNTTSWNLSRILGPALAGFLIAWVAHGDTSSTYGVGIVYLMIAALYFISAATMLLVRRSGNIKAPDDKSPFADMVDGLRYVRENPPVFGLILLSIVPFLFGMPLNTLLPAFNEDILGGGPEDLGMLMSAMGGGAILGSLMLAAMGELRNKAAWLIATCVGWGAFTTAFGSAQVVWLAGALVGARCSPEDTVQAVVGGEASVVAFAGALPKESVVDVCAEVTCPDVPISSCSQQLVELQVKKIFCVSRSVPELPLQLEDASRSEEEVTASEA